MKKKFLWDPVKKILTIRLRQVSLDEELRYREDAAFWGYYTHQKVFRLYLGSFYEFIFSSGFDYRRLPEIKPIDASSYEAHLMATKIKTKEFTIPEICVSTLLIALFLLCYVF